MARKALIAGNWKMHGSSQHSRALVDALKAGVRGDDVQMLICPPAPYRCGPGR